jgi:hypothetical protein
MIEFLTLFVGLMIGVHPVEVAVSGPVVRVEIRLNDRVLAEIDRSPWVASCDFGRGLRPGLVEAVAFDGDGGELARDQRWVNLPGQRADAEIVAIRDEAGMVTAARLTWSSPEFDQPRGVSVRLDGRPVDLRPPYRIDLTGIPARKVHILSADFEFPEGILIRRELVFGPEFEGDHSSGLSAVAVVLEDLDELPPVEDMHGWFVAGGVPLGVAAAETPDARVVFVRDPTSSTRLAEMGPELKRRRKKEKKKSEQGPSLDAFGDDVQLRMLSPEPVSPGNRTQTALLFPISKKPVPGSKGVVEATIGRAPASLLGGPLMMSDAVAVAGIRAAEGNGRRAVVVMLGGAREDGSRFSPDVARRYLHDLRVPLFVWDLSGPSARPPNGWGEMRPVDNVDDLVRNVRRIRYQLSEQRIVWLRGRHLPQSIQLGPEAKGIRLAN